MSAFDFSLSYKHTHKHRKTFNKYKWKILSAVSPKDKFLGKLLHSFRQTLSTTKWTNKSNPPFFPGNQFQNLNNYEERDIVMHNKCPVIKLNRRHQDVPLSSQNHSQKILSFLAGVKATSDQRGWNKYAYMDSFQWISAESFFDKKWC